MGHVMGFGLALLRLALFAAILLPPAWWAAGRIQEKGTNSFFRLLLAVGLALFDYIIVVNLAGRLLRNSYAAVAICLAANALAGAFLWRRRPADEFAPVRPPDGGRRWAAVAVLALALGLPQWFLAVSTNFWDEAVASAIHWTGPNQFAEGIYPPRHNALPDVPIKYHYAFIILSGTTERLLGVSANHAVDVVSTSLWLFTFLFAYFWYRELEFDGLESAWAAFSLLLGGGLAWLYLPRLEAYSGVAKVPPASDLVHRYDPAAGWFRNLVQAAAVPSQHLRNGDGTLSNLPWDIAAQFQQHAVSLGIALTVVGLYLFARWRRREDLRAPLLAANVAAFSVIFLGHAVFGTVAAAAAGIFLLISWARRRTRAGFLDGLIFGVGVAALAFLHGGMLFRGAQYGGGGFATLRRTFGYSAGGVAGFIHWNVAGFGIPLLLALVAAFLYRRLPRGDRKEDERAALFAVLGVFAVFSYFVPQLSYYSSETYGVEQFTEISKFFFSAHFALALLSAYGLAALRGSRLRWLIAPCFLAAAVSPVLFCYANSVDANGSWLGFYRSPYFPGSVEEQMGTALKRLKKGPRDVYFDASADERRHAYLSEMLVFGGSAFTMTPSAYERTGIGFRLSQETTARRYVQNGRIARLLPGSAEAAGCTWYYCRPLDMSAAPLIVRSRFAKLLAEGRLELKAASGLRALYEFAKPTSDLDQDIERSWTPKVVAQTVTDCGGGRNELVFYDYAAQKILCGRKVIALPESARGEFAQLYVARFLGGPRSDFLVGRLLDTDFRLGTKIEQNVEYDGWGWNYLDGNRRPGGWLPEYVRFYWDQDIPLVGDIDHSGYAAHLAYRRATGDWLQAPDEHKLAGPKVDEKQIPVPFVGRFLEGSAGDLGVWSLMDGMVNIKSLTTGKTASFRWGGTYDFILVPGDYDGVGRDEIGVYNQLNSTWYWRRLPDGPVAFAQFGTKTGVPVPWDYDGDGRLDLAYWEPRENKIYVSFDRGRTVGRVVKVPPHSMPAFVNMY
jgi:hypothetical protein